MIKNVKDKYRFYQIESDKFTLNTDYFLEVYEFDTHLVVHYCRPNMNELLGVTINYEYLLSKDKPIWINSIDGTHWLVECLSVPDNKTLKKILHKIHMNENYKSN